MTALTKFNRDKEEVVAEAKALLAVMPGWELARPVESYWCFGLRQKDTGYEIHVSLNEAPKKYIVSGSWPGGKHNRYMAPKNEVKIGVGCKRGHEVLAQQIEKRLMPHIREEWPKILAQLQHEEDCENGRNATVQEFADLLDKEPSKNYPETVWGGSDSYVRKIQVNYDGSGVTIELDTSLPKELAEKLIRWLQAEWKENEE